MIDKTFDYNDVTYEVFEVPRHTNPCEKCVLKDNVCGKDNNFFHDDYMDKYEYARPYMETGIAVPLFTKEVIADRLVNGGLLDKLINDRSMVSFTEKSEEYKWMLNYLNDNLR